jgi:CBS domain-containing protein
MVLSSTTIAAAIDRHPLVVSPDRMVREAIAQMVAGDRGSQSGCAVVVENERVVGIVTDRDLLHLMAIGTPLDRLLVCQVMNREVITLQESVLTDTLPAIALFQQHGLSHLPIVDEKDRLVGIVTSASLLATSDLNSKGDCPQPLERVVEDAEREMNHLFAAIDDVVIEIESGGNHLKILSTNSSSLYYSPADIEGKSLRDLFPPEKAELFIDCIDRALATHTTQECEYSLKIDNVECWFDAKCSPLTADRVLWIARDLSKQQSAIQQHQQAEATLNHLIAGTAATIGADFFPALVSHIATALKVPYVLISELIDDKLHVLAFRAQGSLQPTFNYHPVETPCERTLQDGKYYCQSMIQQQFPRDLELVELGIESYLGVALYDLQGNAIGNLCILDEQTIGNPAWTANILRVFAARAGAELERERANQKLAALNRELEERVRERTIALQASEERCQLVLQGTNDGIWDWDLRTDRVFVSDRWKEMRGFAINEVIDSPQEFLSRIHPDDLDRVRVATEAHF